MIALLSAFVGCVLQAVVKSKNNFLVYHSVSVSFNIKVFTADLSRRHLMVEQCN